MSVDTKRLAIPLTCTYSSLADLCRKTSVYKCRHDSAPYTVSADTPGGDQSGQEREPLRHLIPSRNSKAEHSKTCPWTPFT